MNLLVIAHYQNDGSPTAIFIHDQMRAFVQAGHFVRVIVPVAMGKRDYHGVRMSPILQTETIDGIEHYFLRYVSLSRYGSRAFNTRSAICALQLQLHSALSDFWPDVIHAHTLGFDSEIGAWLKDKLGCPLVVTTHGSDTSILYEAGEKELLCRYCNRADAVVGVSSKLTKALRDCGTKTVLRNILNGFALENGCADAERRMNTWIQVGNLIPQKRVDMTIRAFAAVCQKNAEARLTVVGQGEARPALEQLCAELEISELVRFTGQIPNRDVLKEMAAAQFFVMPSVREGFGIVYLEAMASGCITIGTEGEGIADLIATGENGFLVPPDDYDSIARVVEWCLSHPDEASVIAECGYRAACELTWEKNAKQYIDLFQAMAERI